MSKITDDEITRLFQEGLRKIPVPEVSTDFDRRVRSALRTPQTGWSLLWSALRPLLAPVAISMAITLAAMMVISAPQPGGTAQLHGHAPGGFALGHRSGRTQSPEQELERLDRETPSLGGFRPVGRPEPNVEDPQSVPRGHRPESGRRHTHMSAQA